MFLFNLLRDQEKQILRHAPSFSREFQTFAVHWVKFFHSVSTKPEVAKNSRTSSRSWKFEFRIIHSIRSFWMIIIMSDAFSENCFNLWYYLVLSRALVFKYFQVRSICIFGDQTGLIRKPIVKHCSRPPNQTHFIKFDVQSYFMLKLFDFQCLGIFHLEIILIQAFKARGAFEKNC